MTETIKIKDLKRNTKQPRRSIREADLNTLVESIKRYGLVCPVVITPDHIIIEGHTRLAAATRAGISELEIGKDIIIRDVDPAIYSQVAHTRADPSEMDRAIWLRDRIQDLIQRHVALKNLKKNPLQIVKNIRNHLTGGDTLLMNDAQMNELKFILFAIAPGDEISYPEAERLLIMLGWPDDIKNEMKKSELPKRTLAEVAPIQQKEIRQAVVKEAKSREWGTQKVHDASVAIRSVNTPKERNQVVKALKSGVEPESVRRVTEIEHPKIREKALGDLEEVAKSKKNVDGYVVEVAEETAAGKAQPPKVLLSDPESRYLAEIADFSVFKLRNTINGIRIAKMKNQRIKERSIDHINSMIKYLEEQLEIATGQKAIVIDS